MKVYESRAFCKEIQCPVQLRLDKDWPHASDKESFKRLTCGDCMAWKFHNWLKENKFKIMKEEQ